MGAEPDVQPNDYAEVVEYHEEVTVDKLPPFDVNAHLHDHVPIIYNNQDE